MNPMKQLIILGIILMTSCLSYAKDNRGIEVSEISTDSLQTLIDNENDNKKLVVYLAELVSRKDLQIQQLTDHTKQFDGYEKDIVYLSDSPAIFTSPMPDSTEIRPALKPLARMINSVKEYKDAIDNMNIALDNIKEELPKHKTKTFNDFLETEPIQEQLGIVIDKNNTIETLDLSILSEPQREYINELQEQYNKIISYFQ